MEVIALDAEGVGVTGGCALPGLRGGADEDFIDRRPAVTGHDVGATVSAMSSGRSGSIDAVWRLAACRMSSRRLGDESCRPL